MSRVTEQFEHAKHYLAGGVSSSTRVNRALGHPLYFDRAEGCRLWDLDGREYLDLCTSHGATLLGQTVPSCERVRFTGSGSEATMHAIRLARAFTGRTRLLKFEGNFHGYHDQVMYSIGTPADHLGPEAAPPLWPGSAGLPEGLERNLLLVPYNRPDLVEEAFRRHGDELAAVLMEPVYYNAGCVLPSRELLDTLTRLTAKHGALLMFDEVLSAFRMCPGGAQEYLGVTPDLCTLGKAVGGGMPLSAFGGRKAVMDRLMPTGDCQHSGTYNGHPVAVAAGIAAVTAYRQPGFYDHINAVGAALRDGLAAAFARHGVPAHVQGLGARFGVYFGVGGPVRSYRDAARHQRQAMLKFIASAVRHGVYFHDYGGGACHHGFCAAMTLDDAHEAVRRLDAAVADVS